MKLHLGCGPQYLPGYVNVDLYAKKVDVEDDVVSMVKFDNGVAQEILTNHCLEHLSFDDAQKALRRWYEVLDHGGMLRMEIPDFRQLCKEFAEFGSDIASLVRLYPQYEVLTGLVKEGDLGIYTTWGRARNIFGAQDTPGQFHKSAWWMERLENELSGIGFIEVSIARSCQDKAREWSYHAKEEPVMYCSARKP